MRGQGKFASRNRWNYLTRELEAAAGKERAQGAVADIIKAMQDAHLEISQFHHEAYPDCEGGCPGHEAMKQLEEALMKLGAPLEAV